MTPLELAREAKARKAVERQERYEEAQLEYLYWLPQEREAYLKMTATRAEHGWQSDLFTAAKQAWIALWRNMPQPPPDHAWT